MKVLIRPSKTTCKGNVKSQTLEVNTIDEVAENVPCGNPHCTGGGIPLRDAVARALKASGSFARARCTGAEKSGRRLCQ